MSCFCFSYLLCLACNLFITQFLHRSFRFVRSRRKQYRTGIYFHTPEQEEIVRARMEEEAKKYKKPMATELKAATPFWPAEKYHQQYLEKGGRFGMPQDASKGATETIRCYG